MELVHFFDAEVPSLLNCQPVVLGTYPLAVISRYDSTLQCLQVYAVDGLMFRPTAESLKRP